MQSTINSSVFPVDEKKQWFKDLDALNKKYKIEEKDLQRTIASLAKAYPGLEVELEKETKKMEAREFKERRNQIEFIRKMKSEVRETVTLFHECRTQPELIDRAKMAGQSV